MTNSILIEFVVWVTYTIICINLSHLEQAGYNAACSYFIYYKEISMPETIM